VVCLGGVCVVVEGVVCCSGGGGGMVGLGEEVWGCCVVGVCLLGVGGVDVIGFVGGFCCGAWGSGCGFWFVVFFV